MEENQIGSTKKIKIQNLINLFFHFSSLIPSIGDKIPQTSHSLIAHNQVPVSNLNDNPSTRRVPKRRSVSAATTNCPTIFSITGRNSRGKRTNSASNRKRSYSPASITLPLSNNNQRKKQKILHYWILFGKSEQKLVSIHVNFFFKFFFKKFFF